MYGDARITPRRAFELEAYWSNSIRRAVCGALVATRMDRDIESDPSATALDWPKLLSTAGPEFSRFTPDSRSDTALAWTGAYPGHVNLSVLFEARRLPKLEDRPCGPGWRVTCRAFHRHCPASVRRRGCS